MTKDFRIIARLDIKMNTLIKGVQMEGWRKIGDPRDFAIDYAAKGADELIFTDVVASLYGRNSLNDIVRSVASEVFVPMTVGGGIRSLNDARDLLVCGADKVSLNTGATSNPALIDEIALQFGSQACVISIETIKIDGQWRVMTDNGRNYTGRNALDWAHEVADRGAGELLITSIHNDGVGKGLDLDLINQVCARVDVPVVASGGVGNACHVGELLDNTPASAVAIAQALHWNRVSLNDLRSALNKRGYFVRPIQHDTLLSVS